MMDLFTRISRMGRGYVRDLHEGRRARFDKMEIERVLCQDDGDQFAARITYYYRENSEGITVNEITAAFSPAVDISDRILLEECVNAARGSLKVTHWEIDKVDRIIDELPY